MNRLRILTLFLFTSIPGYTQTLAPVAEHIFVHTDRDYYLAGETIWLKMYCSLPTGTTAPKSAVGYIELANPATATTAIKLKVALNAAGTATINLPDTLPTGMYTLYAYTARSVDSGYYFKKQLTIQNTFDSVLTTMPTNSMAGSHNPTQAGVRLIPDTAGPFARRQKIRLTYQLENISPKLPAAWFSLAVFRVDSLHGLPAQNILPLFSPTEMSRLPVRFSDPLEDNGPVITGHIQTDSTANASDTPAFFSIPGIKPRYYGISTHSGRFAFDSYNFAGNATLLAIAPGHKTSITVDDKFKNIVQYDTDNKSMPAGVDSSLFPPLTKAHISMQVERVFYADSTSVYDPFADSLALRGSYDESVLLDDYTRFTTFEEVFREFVKTVMVRPSHDTLYLRALNNALVNPKFFDEPALVLLDGVPIFDSKKLFKIDPLKIRKVNVYARKVFMGPFVYNGIVLLQTYDGDLAGTPLDMGFGAADISGTATEQTFFSPDYSTALHETLPDQRSLLYWQPNLQTDGFTRTVEFYTGDLPGTYCAVLQGIDPAGTSCYATCFFDVK